MLILDANSSIIYRTDFRLQFNYTHFCGQTIFLLKLKNCINKNFLAWLFPELFKKISNFPDFPLPSIKFPDFPCFPDRVETMYQTIKVYLQKYIYIYKAVLKGSYFSASYNSIRIYDHGKYLWLSFLVKIVNGWKPPSFR